MSPETYPNEKMCLQWKQYVKNDSPNPSHHAICHSTRYHSHHPHVSRIAFIRSIGIPNCIDETRCKVEGETVLFLPSAKQLVITLGPIYTQSICDVKWVHNKESVYHIMACAHAIDHTETSVLESGRNISFMGSLLAIFNSCTFTLYKYCISTAARSKSCFACVRCTMHVAMSYSAQNINTCGERIQ